MRVELAAAQSAGLHLHLCPVVGWVVSGLVRFQVADGPVVLLRAGDAFFGPANVPIPQVDNSSQTEAAVFIACYLLPPGEDRLIEMSEQRRRPSSEHGLVSRTEDRLIRRWTRDRCRGVGSAGLWAEKRGAVVIQGSGEGRATETGPSPNLYRRTRRCRQGDGARSGPSALCAGRVLARAAEGVLTAARANTMSLTQPKSWGVSGFMSPSGPSRTHPANSSGLRHIVFARERLPRSVEGRSPRRARIAGRRRRCGSTSGRSDGRLNAQ